jgi:hypothetical protein
MSNSVPARNTLRVVSQRSFLLLSAFVTFVLSAGLAVAQQPGAAPSVMPGAAIRERNRQMDEYDRELDRLKNGPKVSTERRRNLFPQINEDFQRIQVIHNELVRLVQGNNSLDYNRLVELSGEMKKRTNRLRTNLALPETDDGVDSQQKAPDNPTEPNEAEVKKNVISLHYVVVSFVTSPLFKNLRLLDANEVTKASKDLKNMVQMSDNIKRSVESLTKMAKK